MLEGRAQLATHEVADQPPPRGARDLRAEDDALRAMTRAMGGAGRRGPGAAREAARHPPEARLFDAGGRRLDEVRFH